MFAKTTLRFAVVLVVGVMAVGVAQTPSPDIDPLAGLQPGHPRLLVKPAGNQATLRQNGKALQARLLSPPKAIFSVFPANPPDDGFNEPNPNTRILVVNVTAPVSGRIQLEVALRPGASAW